jgi:hypothetical protein
MRRNNHELAIFLSFNANRPRTALELRFEVEVRAPVTVTLVEGEVGK